MSIILQITGLFLGIFFRTYLPYIRKLKDGSIKKFHKKYLYQAAYSFILALISILLILPRYPLKVINNIDLINGIKIFSTSFAFGFAWNSLINEGGKWRKKKGQ